MLNEVFEIISKEPVALIALNIPHNEESSQQLTGYVLNEILEFSPIPVLLVPEQNRFQPIKKIVFATDFHTLNKEGFSVKNALMLAKIYNAKLHFLHLVNANEPEHDDGGIYKMVKELIDQSDRFSYSKKKCTDVIQSISQFVNENHPDMSIIVKQKRDFLKTVFLEDYIQQASIYSKIPVYILKDNQRLIFRSQEIIDPDQTIPLN